jgi:hypothetical protein
MNYKLSDMLDDDKEKMDFLTHLQEVQESIVANETDTTSNGVEVSVAKPSDMDPNLFQQIVELIEGRYAKLNDVTNVENIKEGDSPSAGDIVSQSLFVAYATLEGIPVGCMVIADPTQEDYMGTVAMNNVVLNSATNLENMVQIMYFACTDDYLPTDVPSMIRSKVEEYATSFFAVTDFDDNNTNLLLSMTHFSVEKIFHQSDIIQPQVLWAYTQAKTDEETQNAQI